MQNIFAILINTDVRNTPVERIEGVLNGAKNWLRFAPNVYFVLTELDHDAWYRRVRAVLNPVDSIMVVNTIETERAGWMSELAVNWFTTPTIAFPFGE